MSDQQDNKINEVAELVGRHYLQLISEDITISYIQRNIKEAIENSMNDEKFKGEIVKLRQLIFNYLFNYLKGIGLGNKKAKDATIKIVNHIENSIKREFYLLADHVVEPVRLGMYRSLLYEAYRLVHGDCQPYFFTTHGVMKESVKRVKLELKLSKKILTNSIEKIMKRNLEQYTMRSISVLIAPELKKSILKREAEKYHFGIDLAIFFNYHQHSNKNTHIVVPLFIVAKHSTEDIEKFYLMIPSKM